jgi:transcriptional regulator with XRE-family HTH domain
MLYAFLGYSLVVRQPLRDRLRAWRAAAVLTHRQVARRLRVSMQTVRRLETSNTRPVGALRDAVERLVSERLEPLGH